METGNSSKDLWEQRIAFGDKIDYSQFDWSEEIISKMDFSINEIESYLNKEINQENYQNICNNFFYLIDKIPLPVHLLDVTFLLRGRPNFKGEIFKEKSDISYNTKSIDNIKPGRFNRQFESVFYAAVPTGEQYQLVFTVSLECCKLLVDDDNCCQVQYLTFGKWYLNERFPVVFLCFDDEVLKKIKNIDVVIENYYHDLEALHNKKIADVLISFWKFLSKYSCQENPTEQQYFITTAFFNCIKVYYPGMNGIIYPSSMTKCDGLNIVLTPEAVDKYLNLKEVFMYKFQRNPSDAKQFFSDIASNIFEYRDGNFNFSAIW